MLARKSPSQFRRFNSSPEVIRLVVMMYVRHPLSLRNVEELLADRGIDVSYETVRFWWTRFGAGDGRLSERHLTGRDPFKADRPALLAEWKALAA